jgi:Mannose-6-phosphate isomerase
VTVNELVKTVHENESINIPTDAVYRLENPSEIQLELIEVQTGSYFGKTAPRRSSWLTTNPAVSLERSAAEFNSGPRSASLVNTSDTSPAMAFRSKT